MKTWATVIFNQRKQNGKIKKYGKGRFHDGNRECERVVYVDIETDEKYVFLNGNVHRYRLYHNQPYEYYIGTING